MGQHVNSQAISVRLRNELVDVIDAEAKAQGISRNELLRRRIETSFRHVHVLQKTATESRKTAGGHDDLPALED